MPIQLALFDVNLYTVTLPAEPTQVEAQVVKVDTRVEYQQLELDLFPQPPRIPQRKLSKVAA
jgi:hypothetical protein